jgi:sortase A
VVEGVALPDLKKGPGHYPETPMPGQQGNAAIAGHRTTYGAPFFRLDELQAGDRVFVTTKQGQFTYRVQDAKVVRPDQNEVLAPSDANLLTLTTCHPRFSASRRLIVTAALSDEPAPAPSTTTTTAPDTTGTTLPGSATTTTTPETPAFEEESLSGDAAARGPALAWGSLAALVWLLSWLASKRWGRLAAYAFGTPVFLVVLFVFFENFARLLPANV